MKTWFTSDQHFFHSNILTFKNSAGGLIRPGFDDVFHMNEVMVERWNAVVGFNDKVYHLGDFSMGTSHRNISIASRLNGDKVLIKGNHDNAKLKIYSEFFRDIRSEVHLKTPEGDIVVFTHRPIRFDAPNAESNIVHFNVHGHLHQNEVADPRYINVCVEHTNYTPVSWEELLLLISRRKKQLR